MSPQSIRPLYVLLAAAVFMTACGESTEPPDGGPDASTDGGDDAAVDGGEAGYAAAYTEDDCAPDDGPAVRVTLHDGLGGDCTTDSLRGTLVISIHGGTTFPIPPGTTVRSSPTDGGIGNGSATLCPGGTPPCLVSQDFVVTFDEFVQDDHSAGSYSIVFDGGRVEEGTFDAPWCGGDALCG